IRQTLGDFNNDGKLDFAMANAFGAGAGVALGNGNGTFQPLQILAADDGFNNFGIASADFNGDHLADLAVANTFQNTLGVVLNAGTPTTTTRTTTTLSTSVPAAVFGQSVTLTARVASAAGIPVGATVNFLDGGLMLGSAAVDATGQATLRIALGV